MSQKVYVIGVGMTKFVKPGTGPDYPDLAKEAGEKALKDAGVNYDQIESAFVGYVYGDSTCGQRALYELGMTGIPIVNVNNNCSTGSTALYLAKNAIQYGQVKCAIALGFEKMQRGSLNSQYSDRANPMEKHVEAMLNKHELTTSPMAPQMFGNAGRDYAKKYNLKEDDDVFARIAWKNHKHSVNNPYSQFRDEYSLDDIKKSPVVYEPLTKLQCCPTSDGAACAILANEEFVRKHKLEGKAVEILAMEMATDLQTTFSDDCMKVVGYDMTKTAARKAFDKAGIKPTDVQVVELHDCFSANELITYEALGLCPEGKAPELVRSGNNTYGGKYVVNPSGGLISKGHPLGATGLAQCSELCWQLRGQADARQVSNVKYALQHNIGLGGAVVVAIYKLGFGNQQSQTASSSDFPNHKSAKFFKEIQDRIKVEGKAFRSKVNAIIGFEVVCAGNQTVSYTIDLKNGDGELLINNKTVKPECTITINDDDILSIMEGKLSMMTAFSQKKLKISGQMGIAMKLNQIFAQVKPKSKL